MGNFCYSIHFRNVCGIKVVFQHGEFTYDDTIVTASALFFYSFGMIGYAVCETLNKSFYAVGDGKTPMLTSLFGIAVNFASAFIFVVPLRMGIGGLALASAASSLSMAPVLLFAINHRKHGVITVAFVLNILKIIVTAILCGFAAWFSYNSLSFLATGTVQTFLVAVAAGLAALLVYAVAGFILRIDQYKQIRRFGNEQ